ncbi:MAG: YceI family protein [Actinobacteria bacterium]|nr:YceI family protein [Actinomycetota bacterium]
MTTTTASTLSELTGTYTIDPAHSRIGFVARHAMVTKVRGAFNDLEGTAVLDGDDPSRSTASVTVQAASIDTRSEQRDGHVRGADFFDVENYPTITFVSTSARQNGDVYELTGDLTVKGITKSVTVPFSYEGAATDPYGNQRVGFEGSVTVNRKDFGLDFNAPLATGGVLVGEKVVLEFEISAIKSA